MAINQKVTSVSIILVVALIAIVLNFNTPFMRRKLVIYLCDDKDSTAFKDD